MMISVKRMQINHSYEVDLPKPSGSSGSKFSL